jgi:hypothetical protein
MGREVERCPTGLEDRTQVGLGGVILKTIGSVFVLYENVQNACFTASTHAICIWIVFDLELSYADAGKTNGPLLA